MLKPKKHMDLDLSVLRVSAIVLHEARKKRLVSFEALRKRVIRQAGEDADLVFVPALSFLYLLGKIEYHLKNDTVEYIEREVCQDAN